MAQSTASTTFDFPHPLGPTIVVIPSGKERWRRSTKDLNPITSSDFSFIELLSLNPNIKVPACGRHANAKSMSND
jgi:hypothetical protein